MTQLHFIRDHCWHMGQVTELWLSCYLVLLSNDSKTRQQDSRSSVTWPICKYNACISNHKIHRCSEFIDDVFQQKMLEACTYRNLHSQLLALCEGNRPVTGGVPWQRPSNAELEVRNDNWRMIHIDKKPFFPMTFHQLFVYKMSSIHLKHNGEI